MSRMLDISNATCHYCSEPATTRDHIVPRARGGRSGNYNLVPSCTPCNEAKGDSWPTCECSICENARTLHRLRAVAPPTVVFTAGEFCPRILADAIFGTDSH